MPGRLFGVGTTVVEPRMEWPGWKLEGRPLRVDSMELLSSTAR